MIHTLNFGFVQSYLIPCEGGYFQIDTGLPNQYPNYRKKLSHLDIEIHEIRWLLLTHHHVDHTGFAAALLKDSEAGLIAHDCGRLFLKNGTISNAIRPINPAVRIFFAPIIGILSRYQHPIFPPIHPPDKSIFITDDSLDVFANFGFQGNLIHTPGHTSDSISLILKDGTAFCGDALMNNPLFQLLGTCHQPFIVESKSDALQSWKKLLANGALRFYPAHGRPVTAEKLASIHSALSQKSG